MSWNKWEHIFTDMISKYSMWHEAYFGIGKLLLSKDELENALEMFELSLRAPKRDPVYILWTCFALYYLYKETKNVQMKKQYSAKLQKYATESLRIDQNDINLLFILLYFSIDWVENFDELRIASKFKPEDLAAWIKDIDNYKGYLAWVEIYIHRKDIQFAHEVLQELINFYPDNPEAYFKLWTLKRNKDPEDALSTAEELFLCTTNFYTLEIKIIIDLVYAEALFNAQQHIQCLEFLQNEFTKFPVYTIFLLYYGKFVILAQEESYYGSGIGALQECLRVWINDTDSDTKAKPSQINKSKTHNPNMYTDCNYYLGLFYMQSGRYGKAYSYFMKAKTSLKYNDHDKKEIIDKFLTEQKHFIQILESAKKAIKSFENSHTIYSISESKIEKLIPSLNEVRAIDPITVSILKSEVYSQIFRDKIKGWKELKILMNEYPANEEAYAKYWILMKQMNNIKELEDISNKLQQVCASPSVPTNSWVESIFKQSEMFVQKGEIEEALRSLKKIWFILPPMPLPKLNYIDKAAKIDNEVLDNLQMILPGANDGDPDNLFDNSLFGDDNNMFGGNTMNDSELLDFKILNLKQDDDPTNRISLMSEIEGNIGAGDKSLIITKHLSTPEETTNIKLRLNMPNMAPGYENEHHRLQSVHINDERNLKDENQNNESDFDIHNISMTRQIYNGRGYGQNSGWDQKNSIKESDSRVSRSSLPRLSYAFGKKLGNNVGNANLSRRHNTDLLSETQIGQVVHESESFSVYSDLKFLYQIGKICAESGKYLEEGILCLDDYINLLNFLHPTESQQTGKVYQMKTKALYLVGLIFYQINDYEEAEKFLNQVRMDLKEIKEKEKFDKWEHMLAQIFQEKFDIYSTDDVIRNYFYPESGDNDDDGSDMIDFTL